MDTHIPVRRITKPAEASKYPPASHHQSDHEELGDFVSAQDLHLMSGTARNRSLATTYRVLKSLAKAGELDSVKGIEGETCTATVR